MLTSIAIQKTLEDYCDARDKALVMAKQQFDNQERITEHLADYGTSVMPPSLFIRSNIGLRVRGRIVITTNLAELLDNCISYSSCVMRCCSVQDEGREYRFLSGAPSCLSWGSRKDYKPLVSVRADNYFMRVKKAANATCEVSLHTNYAYQSYLS